MRVEQACHPHAADDLHPQHRQLAECGLLGVQLGSGGEDLRTSTLHASVEGDRTVRAVDQVNVRSERRADAHLRHTWRDLPAGRRLRCAHVLVTFPGSSCTTNDYNAPPAPPSSQGHGQAARFQALVAESA